MSKPPRTSSERGPVHEVDAHQNPPAAPRALNETDEEKLLAQVQHHRRGAKDPIPSVRAAFAEHAKANPIPQIATDEEGNPVERSPLAMYDGPFIVEHGFTMAGPDGARVVVKPRMPLPGGGIGRRILHKGDIPAELAQKLWADGTLSAYRPPRPKPQPSR